MLDEDIGQLDLDIRGIVALFIYEEISDHKAKIRSVSNKIGGPTMQTLYKPEKDTAVSERKEFLKHELRKMGVNVTLEGRNLEEVSLYTLEWNYVVAKNEKLREESKKRIGFNLEG